MTDKQMGDVKCKSIFGHKYIPVITKDGAKGFKYNAASCSEYHVEQMFDATRNQTFNGIYCERCGHIKEIN